MNQKQVSKITLSPETVDCFVFWTKNPKPMLKHLDELKEYKYYFQFTITGFNSNVEKGIHNKPEIIETFKSLSRKIGSDRVILRYDPIFLSKEYTIQYHIKAFKKLCSKLQGYTHRCVISFIDLYNKTERNTKSLNIINMTTDDINNIAAEFFNIAKEHNIKIETCSESYDLSKYGIEKGKCIDDKVISEVIGYEVNVKKDDTQRDVCGCVKSIDIGQYNTCMHHCLYCYANFNGKQALENFKIHDENYPLLIGKVREDAKITARPMKSIKGKKLGREQISFLDNLK